MTFDSIVEALRRVELFDGLKQEQILEIAREAERVTFKTGDVIITAETSGDAAFVILSGEALHNRPSDKEGAAEAIEPGSLAGEMSMLIDTQYHSTVTCRGPVLAVKITRAALHAQMARDADLAERLVEKIASRLHVIARQLQKIEHVLAQEPCRPTSRQLALPAPGAERPQVGAQH